MFGINQLQETRTPNTLGQAEPATCPKGCEPWHKDIVALSIMGGITLLSIFAYDTGYGNGKAAGKK